MGRYGLAIALCRRAVDLAPDSAVAHACVGVSCVYSGDEQTAVASAALAWRLAKDQPEKAFLLESSIFSVTPEALEVNLLTALRSFGRFKECAEAGVKSFCFYKMNFYFSI